MKALSGALERGCGLSQAVTPSPVATAPTPPRSSTLRPLQLLNAFLLRKAWRSPGQHLPKPPMKGHPVEEANSLCRGQPRSSPAPWGMGGTLSLAVIRGVKATKWWQMAGDTSQGPESLHEASRRRGAPTQRQHGGVLLLPRQQISSPRRRGQLFHPPRSPADEGPGRALNLPVSHALPSSWG